MAETKIISAFPNPGTGLFQLSYGEPINGHASITNPTGQSSQILIEDNCFDISELPAGLYLLSIQTASENLISRVILH